MAVSHIVSFFIIYLFSCYEAEVAEEVNVKIFGNNVTFIKKDLKRRFGEYDGVYNYICEEGYSVDLSCSNNYNHGSIQMRYYDAQGNIILESDTVVNHKASLMFRQLMTSTTYNGSYVDCTYNKPIPDNGFSDYFTYRIVFTVLNKMVYDDFIVTINNVKLIPTKSASNADEPNKYDFKYISGEELTATCENTLGDKVYGSVIDTQNKTIKSFTDTNKPLVVGVSIDTRPYILGNLQCSSSKDDRVKADVNFSVSRSHYPVVHGLRASDILLQYSQNYSVAITKYQYTDNEVFKLYCFADEGWTPKWVPGDKQIPGWESGNFTLRAEHNNTSITCKADKMKEKDKESPRQMVIVFQLKLAETGSNEDNGSSLVVIISCVVGVLVVVVCAVCGYCWYTKKRATNGEARPNINPNESETYDYAYIEAGGMIENAYYCGSTDYKVPQDNVNSTKNPAESHYSEIGDYCKNKNEKKALTYDVPYDHVKKNNNATLNNVNYENLNQENINKPYSNLQREINNMHYSNLKNKNTNYENL